MEQREKRVTEYLVPANVSARFEFFEGFGWKELKIVTIALIIGVIFFFLTGLITKTIEISPDDLTFEQQMGLTEKELIPNENGFIEFTKQTIPAPLRILLIIIPGATAFFLVKRDPSSGMSLILLVNNMMEFKKRQKQYIYKYNSGSEG